MQSEVAQEIISGYIWDLRVGPGWLLVLIDKKGPNPLGEIRELNASTRDLQFHLKTLNDS